MAIINKPNTFVAGTVAVSSEVNSDFDTIYNDYNGNINNTNIVAGAGIVDTKLAQITTASKVHGTSLTGLASISTTAGYIPVANMATGTSGLFLMATSATSNSIYTYPLSQTAFLSISAAVNSATGDGTSYILLLATEIFDKGNNFSSGYFIAPVTGKYLFSTNIFLNSVTQSHTRGQAQINTTARDYIFENNAATLASVSSSCSYQITALADMAAGDSANASISVLNGTKSINIDTHTYFSGVLVA